MCQGSVTAASLLFMNGSLGWEMNHQWLTSPDSTQNKLTLGGNDPQAAALHGEWELLQVLRMNPTVSGTGTIPVTKSALACLGACTETALPVLLAHRDPAAMYLCRLFAELYTMRKPKAVRRSWAGMSRKPGCSSLPVCASLKCTTFSLL